jgi:hypothetical protein
VFSKPLANRKSPRWLLPALLKPLRLTKGGFFFQPAHQIGGGTFQPNTLVFISFDGPADTHWVDDKGTEITGL